MDALAADQSLVDLVGRDFVPEAPGQIWYTDITYAKLWSGWAYLAVIRATEQAHPRPTPHAPDLGEAGIPRNE